MTGFALFVSKCFLSKILLRVVMSGAGACCLVQPRARDALTNDLAKDDQYKEGSFSVKQDENNSTMPLISCDSNKRIQKAQISVAVSVSFAEILSGLKTDKTIL